MIDSAYKVDRLQMYFGVPYKASDRITIKVPFIQDIIDYGENNFYSMLNIFIGNPTMYRVYLWDNKIDWNKISDFDLFIMMHRRLDPEFVKLIFEEDINFQKFEVKQAATQDKQIITLLVNQEQKILIDEVIFNRIAYYLRTLFNFFPKIEKAKGKETKKWIIEEEKEKLAEKESDVNSSMLFPLISACVNHPGFKYKLQELRQVNIMEFMDSVQRLQIYESTVALNLGRYSGMADMSKVDDSLFNFMREIKTHEQPKQK